MTFSKNVIIFSVQGIFSTPKRNIKIWIYNIPLTSDTVRSTYSQKCTESLEILHYSWGIVINSVELSFCGHSPQPWETMEKVLELRRNGKTPPESRMSHIELHESDLSLLSQKLRSNQAGFVFFWKTELVCSPLSQFYLHDPDPPRNSGNGL